ncbi:hypothetical protein SNE40_016575 [Patella caerulea]|uniref:Receptor ligand binding region domain-containing protein n=1 Tax=Patella caerulea TaxID=87958 RepID=A0AAN8PCF3_PATCE
MFNTDNILLETAVKQIINRYNIDTEDNIHINNRSVTIDTFNGFNVSRALCSLLSNGAIAIIGVSSRNMLPIIRSHAENIRVPFISINNPAISFDEGGSKFEYYIKPSTARAVVDLVEFYEWDKVYYFYDNGECK